MLTEGRHRSASAMAALDMFARMPLLLQSACSSRRERESKSMAAAASSLAFPLSFSAFSSGLLSIRCSFEYLNVRRDAAQCGPGPHGGVWCNLTFRGRCMWANSRSPALPSAGRGKRTAAMRGQLHMAVAHLHTSSPVIDEESWLHRGVNKIANY